MARRNYPGVHGARPDRRTDRQTGAKDRQAMYDTISPAHRLARLDARLGMGVGAVKERARLGA